MLEEERNKYFEQARQATLAEIAGNQQAMLDNAFAEVPNLPGGEIEPAVVTAEKTQATQPFQSPINPTLVAEEASKYPGGTTSVPGTASSQPAQQPFQNPLNPNLVAEAAQQQPGVYVGHGMTMPAGLAQQANEAATAALSPTPFDDVVDEVDAAKAEQAKQAEIEKILDPRIQRAENARKWVSGIGDALASVANLVGTGHFASNQKQTYSLPGVNEAIEKDRARRQAGYQKQLDRLNALEIQAAKDKQAEAERAAKKAQQDADRALKKEQGDRDYEYKKDKDERDFNYKQEKDARDFEYRKGQDDIKNRQGWARIAKMKDNGDNPGDGGEGAGNGSSSRYSGKRGGGIKEAKTDYNAMLDEIAENNGCESWADLTNRARNDRSLRQIYNQFDLSKEKAGSAKIEGMISHYAKDYAPEFHAYYYGGDVDDKVDFGGFKPSSQQSTATSGGTLAGIMNSGPSTAQQTKKPKREKRNK